MMVVYENGVIIEIVMRTIDIRDEGGQSEPYHYCRPCTV